ncbi:MAG: hypothetical protein Q9207_006560 [Kuettlingeria erythrocarpa]
MAERSLQRRPFELSHARARQASTSSSEASSAIDDKSTSTNPRRRRASPASADHQPAAAVSGEPSRRQAPKQTSAGPREKSSKASSLNMTAPVDSAGEVSYTPTTHRISKAKKGKKVHVCEFPGCNKVFTRAEHRKRHEANHNPNPKFECHVEDCRKGFQRADLLNRHLERQHEIPAGTAPRPPGSYRSMSETSSNPPSGSIMPSSMGQPQPVPAQSMSHGPGAMAITSIIEHPMQELSYSTQGMGDLAHAGVGPMPIGYRPELTQTGSISSQSSVSDMQAIIHMELFARYRARSAKVEDLQGMPQFQSLYKSLLTDSRSLQLRAVSLQQTLGAMYAPTQLHAACTRWIDLEARRRILAAAFVIDTQHSHLLQQPPSYTGSLGEEGSDLPFPNSAKAWNCASLLTWRDLVISEQHLSASSLDFNLSSLDPFQSSVLTCYQLHCLQSSADLIQRDIILHPTKSHFIATTLTHHALSLSSYTPLHALIMAASESWLFGTKITEETVWQQAKTTLRDWVAGDAAKKAVWHATHALRLVFLDQSQQQQQVDGNGNLHDLWCLYIAVLVCWAFGYGTAVDVETRNEYPAENAEMLARNYLGAMDVPMWDCVLGVPEWSRRNTRGLLECVRVRMGEMDMGGLLNGAEDVLFRLVEGNGETVKF